MEIAILTYDTLLSDKTLLLLLLLKIMEMLRC